MAKITSDVGKTSKNIAARAARQIVAEPFEMLKTAGKQVAAPELDRTYTPDSKPNPAPTISSQDKRQIQERDTRLITALEQELSDITKQKEQQERQKAEEERLNKIRLDEKAKSAPQVSSKRSRRLLGFGPKAKAESLKTRIEKPLPPTG